MAVRSGALNLYRKNTLKQQAADIKRSMNRADVLSLSEVHGNDIAKWARENGYGYFKGPDDTAILWNPDAVELIPGTQGSERLNSTRGRTGGMRRRHAAYAQFRDKKSGKEFWQVSAHTTPPNQGSEEEREKIRNEQYQSLKRLSRRLGGPVLIAGDLNFRNPEIAKDMESGFDGGIMHSIGSGASTVDLDRIGKDRLNSDHAAVIGEYKLDGGGNNRFNLEKVDMTGKGSRRSESGGARSGKDERGVGGRGGGSSEMRDWAADYGWSYAFLQDHPQLKDVFDKAIENNWSPQRFIAEIQDTPWFKKHADTWRQAVYLQATDPKTYDKRVTQIRQTLADRAGALGIEVGGATLQKWADQAMRFGWDDAKINNHLARQVKIMGENTVGGDLASTQDQLNRWALDNGVKINKKTMQSWLREVVRGNSTFQEYKQYITKMAVAQHPNWAKELKAGMSVAEIAEPYRNTAAQMLELAPDDIDLNGKLLKRALSFKKDDGTYDSMALYDFEDMLRQDPRWQKTDQAKQQYMETGSAVLKMFGLST